MSSSTDRFNKAARDGYLDALKEATRKDLNSHDEDGMTPTLWAAFEGNLDALRLIVGRGGDPDKCDNYGNTALHFAAARGHLNCVSFLSNFGVNFWSLDIDLHTAKDLAAINNKNEILCYLDAAITKFEGKDKKKVKSLKEKAEKDAAKRIKEFDKLQQKANENMKKEQEKLEKKREKMMRSGSIENGNNIDQQTESITNLTNQTGYLSLRGNGVGGGGTGGDPSSRMVIGQSQKFSDFVTKDGHGGSTNGRGALQKLKLSSYTGVYKKVQQRKTLSGGRPPTSEFTVGQFEADGKRSVRSLSGLQRDSEIMYVPKYDMSENNPGKRGKINGLFASGDDADGRRGSKSDDASGSDQEQGSRGREPPVAVAHTHVPAHSTVSIFERPGFGSVAFRHTSSLSNYSAANAFSGLGGDNREQHDEDDDEGSLEFDEEDEIEHESNGDGTTQPGVPQLRGPWDDIDVPASDNEDEGEDTGALELFLAAAGLQSYIPVFLREKMDLDGLMDIREDYLEQHFGLDPGPRKKLMKAINDRKDALENPGEVYDSRL